MTEKIVAIRGRFLLIVAIFFLGVVSSPKGWNFWEFLDEISNSPEVMSLILYGVAGVVIMKAILYIIDSLRRRD